MTESTPKRHANPGFFCVARGRAMYPMDGPIPLPRQFRTLAAAKSFAEEKAGSPVEWSVAGTTPEGDQNVSWVGVPEGATTEDQIFGIVYAGLYRQPDGSLIVTEDIGNDPITVQ